MSGRFHHDQGPDSVFRTVAAVGASLAVGLLAVRPITDPDAWWNLRAGKELLKSGTFSGPDTWSQFTSYEFVLTEWLGSVAAAITYEWAGPAAIVGMRAIGVIALFCLLVIATRRVSDLERAIGASLLSIFAASGSLSERPQTLGLIFLMISIMAWRRAAETGTPSWWMIPLSWVWACSHGYWVFGPLIGIMTMVGCLLDTPSWAVTRRFSSVVACSVAAAALTPVGPQLLLMPTRIHGAASGLVDEWKPAEVTDPLTAAAFLGAVVVALVWLYRPSLWWQRLHLGLAVAAMLSYARLTAVGALLLAPLLAAALQALKERRPLPVPQPERRTFALCAGVLLVSSCALAGPVANLSRDVPMELLPRLRHLPGRTVLLNDYNVSSWLLVAAPNTDLVIDSRTELFSAAYLQSYSDAWQAKPGWDAYVRETRARWALLRRESPLAVALQDRAGWTVTASDNGYVLLERGSRKTSRSNDN